MNVSVSAKRGFLKAVQDLSYHHASVSVAVGGWKFRLSDWNVELNGKMLVSCIFNAADCFLLKKITKKHKKAKSLKFQLCIYSNQLFSRQLHSDSVTVTTYLLGIWMVVAAVLNCFSGLFIGLISKSLPLDPQADRGAGSPTLPSDSLWARFSPHLFSFFSTRTPPVDPYVTSAGFYKTLHSSQALRHSPLCFLGNSAKCQVLLLAAAWGCVAKNWEELRT